jgi:tRNA/tmRNA/rRNA uracil-C5-methylase (TrmA/RlmC/RlmD family)
VPDPGTLVELSVGPVAHGGFCVARLDEDRQSPCPDGRGRVVFVRHALPGELVRARITEDRGGRFCRADAVEILQAAEGRVEPPCPHAGPGRCGGCDWQHVSGPVQRDLKAAVVREQFHRLAGLDVSGLLSGVEQLPGGGGLLGWRSRVTFAVGPDGRPGLRRHRSHEIEPIASCPLGAPGVGDSDVLNRNWPGLTGIEAVRDDDGAVAILAHRPGPGQWGSTRQPARQQGRGPQRTARGRRPPDRVELVDGSGRLRHRVAGHEFEVAASGFWQVHPAALTTFARALLAAVLPAPGECVLDLYAGAGALTAWLADAVGPSGRVVGLETAVQAVADAGANLADLPWAEVRRGRVNAAALAVLDVTPDVVVLDPPRAGAGREVINAVLDHAPRAVGYLACDPAALARDAAVAFGRGWSLRSLRAFDAFPMTHHVECVALLEPGRARLR